MPELPVYNQKQNIEAGLAAPVRNEATADLQSIDTVTKTLAGIAKTWSDANDQMEFADARAKFGTAVAQIQASAATKPFDPNDKEALTNYNQQIQQAKTTYLGGISNKMVQQKAAIDFEGDAAIAQIKIGSVLRKQQMDYTKGVTIPTLLDNAQTALAGIASPTEFAHEKLKVKETINGYVATGILSNEEAHKMLSNFEFNTAMGSVYSNTAVAREQINNGFYDLPPDQKGKLLERANLLDARHLKEQTELMKEVQFKTESDVVTALASGKPRSVQDIINATRNNSVSADFARVYMKAVSSPAMVAARTNDKEFATLTEGIFNSTDKEQVQKSLVAILKGGGDGKLSQEDLGILINSAMRHSQDFQSENMLTLGKLSEWANGAGVDRVSAIREYQKNIAKDMTPKDAMEAAQLSVASNQIPGVAAVGSLPNMIFVEGKPTKYLKMDQNKNIFPARIFNEATGLYDVNLNRARSTKETKK